MNGESKIVLSLPELQLSELDICKMTSTFYFIQSYLAADGVDRAGRYRGSYANGARYGLLQNTSSGRK